MKYKKGDKVCTTGKGKTSTWKKTCGVIEKVWKNSVAVTWYDAPGSDEMSNKEIKKIRGK